eukprot:c27926_g1_i3 orf=632-2377(-)
MDFDEYEYLEKTVERESNGIRGRDRGNTHKRSHEEDGYRQQDRNKKFRDGEELGNQERVDKERGERDIRGYDTLNNAERQRGESGERFERSRRHSQKEHERDKSDRDREQRDRERSRSGDKGRDQSDGRHRSLSRSKEMDHHWDRERYRERDRVGEDRDREKEYRDRNREREYRHSKERREMIEEAIPAEPEADPERDQRTVFAYQICLKADERDVYEFFSKAGKVRDVRLIMDRNSRRSKGVGYIEFYDAMSVPMAIAMSGQLLRGQPVMVKPSEAEKNLVQSTSSVDGAGFIGPYSGAARRLYVGNLHFNITEDQLRQVFEPFGPVELVQLPTDPDTGLSKGFGFVQYARLEDARTAQAALNGVLELAGRVIKVSAVTEQAGMQEMSVAAGELDDDGGGLSLTAQSRALLMQKLDRSGTVSSIATASVMTPIANSALSLLAPGGATFSPFMARAVLGQVGLTGVSNPGLPGTIVGSATLEPGRGPSECLMLNNMFDPKTETDPDFDLDIKDEVQMECSKFGVVRHIFVDKYSPGHVYLRFDSLVSASNAQRALHGRWFAGKVITATFLSPQAYNTKFPG